MDKLVTLLALALSFLLPKPPPLQTEELNTSPFQCPSGPSKLIEVNSEIGAMNLQKVYVWTGLDMYSRADLVFHLVKSKIGSEDGADARTIAVGCVDRYAEPTSLQGQTLTFDFTPHSIEIPRGWQARMYVSCKNFGGPTRAQVRAILYYTPLARQPSESPLTARPPR